VAPLVDDLVLHRRLEPRDVRERAENFVGQPLARGKGMAIGRKLDVKGEVAVEDLPVFARGDRYRHQAASLCAPEGRGSSNARLTSILSIGEAGLSTTSQRTRPASMSLAVIVLRSQVTR